MGGGIGSGGRFAWGVSVRGGGVRGLGRSNGSGGGGGLEEEDDASSVDRFAVGVVGDASSP